MKRSISPLLIVLLSLTILLLWIPTLSAQAGSYGDLIYTVTDGQVAITDYSTSASGELIIPDTIDGYPVTAIESRAFYNCDTITSVVIPNSVTTIGEKAFYDCGKLISVTIPPSVEAIGEKAFGKCDSLANVYISDLSAWCAIDFPEEYANPIYLGENLYLNNELVTDLVIPEGTTIIKDYAFYHCTGLTSVNISDSVSYIGKNAFIHCTGLTSAVIGKGVTDMGVTAFGYCDNLTTVTLGSSITQIPNECFMYCGSLETIVIPEGVTTIGQFAFCGCTGLKEVTIPDSVTGIASSGFSGCSSLTEVTIPEGVTEIADYAFSGCKSLTKVSLADSVTSIGRDAFSTCTSLPEITIPAGVTSIGNQAFNNCSALTEVVIPDQVVTIDAYAFQSCTNLTKLTIGSSVTTIGTRAFFSCKNLSEVHTTDLKAWCQIDYADEQSTPMYYASKLYLNDTLLKNLEITEGVSEIADYAFYNCQSLTTLTMPADVTAIGDHAFYNCKALTSITLGEKVAVIGASAFQKCSALPSVTIPASVTTIGSSAFTSCSKLKKVYTNDLEAWCRIEFADMYANPTACSKNLYYNNRLLTKLTIPDGITQIQDYAFCNCESITAVTLTDSVTRIGKDAFYNCKGLTSIAIVASVTDIAPTALRGCSSLTAINVDENNAFYTSDSKGVLFDKGMTTLLAAPGGITGAYTVPNGVSSIETEAFYQCAGLTAVSIPNTVVSMGYGVFNGCSSLATAVLPEGITEIGKQMFYKCESLTAVKIPDGVISVANYAFQYCRSLADVHMPETLSSIGSFTFNSCSSLPTIVLPAGITQIGKCAFSQCSSLNTIEFKGAAPTFGSSVFEYVTADALYPAEDASWTEQIRSSYGGTITWVPVDPASVKPTIALKYPTVSFEDEIIMNVYYAATDLQDVTEMGLITYSQAVDTLSVETAETVTPGYSYSESEGLYMVNSHGIAAKDMDTALYFAVYAQLRDGSYVYSPQVSYSPADYAATLLNTGSAEMKALMAATLSYGGAAQNYFGLEGTLSQVDTSGIEPYRADMMSPVVQPDSSKIGDFEKTGGFESGYPTVSFEGAFSINYYFTPANAVASDVQLYYWTAEDYTAAETMTADNATGVLTMEASSAGYQAAVEGIAAKDLDDTVYVACVYSDGENRYCSGVLAYSIGAYCATLAQTPGALGELAAATAVYGYYAKQLFGA